MTRPESETGTCASSDFVHYEADWGITLHERLTDNLPRPPLSARFSRLTDSIYNFFGLYLVSLFSLDPYNAAQNSQFNVIGRPNSYQDRSRWGGVNRTGNGSSGGSGGGGGWGSGSDRRGPGGGGPSRRLGTVDDVRGPECGSCQ